VLEHLYHIISQLDAKKMLACHQFIVAHQRHAGTKPGRL